MPTTNGDLMSFDDDDGERRRSTGSNDRRRTRSVFDESWDTAATTSAFVARNPEMSGSSTVNNTSRRMPSQQQQQQQQPYLEYEQEEEEEESDDLLLGLSLSQRSKREPVITESGLLLTHRQSDPTAMRRRTTSPPTTSSSPRIPMNYEHACYTTQKSSSPPRLTISKVQRLFGFTKLMLLGLSTALVLGTMTIWHHSRYENQQQQQIRVVPKKQQQQQQQAKQQILLLPLNLTTTEGPLGSSSHHQKRHLKVVDEFDALKDELEGLEGDVKHVLGELRDEFEEWVAKHQKKYESEEDKERRFHIWTRNHHETRRKNERHGPCQMTKQAVFGSNKFKDLTSQEFQARYLTGYNGPKTDQMKQQPPHRRTTQQQKETARDDLVLEPPVDPRTGVERHEELQKKYELYLQEQPALSHFLSKDNQRRSLQYGGTQASYSGSCRWYDVSCWLRWFVHRYGFGIGGTMEPAYDADSYPSSMDWRDMGAVSEVHSQGNCGACWAITAVETIESAYYIKKGTLYELAESEVILCDDSCEGCNGGWPQNAYEYVIDHNGLPLENSYPYDGDTLYVFTELRGGNNEYYEYYDLLSSYESSYCPAGSGDNNNNGGTRYAKIKGYGYATDRCVCYTDGTGCDCDDQNEKIALMNVASYGPATVCLEASVWQDYAGGIITSSSGCSAAFLDMNHCVQAVGYAFVDSNGDDTDMYQNDNSGSGNSGGSGGSGGSQDDGNREGYWIIRNQWSEDWGMNGYAYVAMGENTCGVLNDMTQAYM
eukprot:CAMPEP_0194030554 /NCGR_PEP_ID=MMETSP0009_2-20130614/3992_1 /TAXON_ID=210454 /ORGANISM="Grammatophora oceanica, Strain CCMP 410" /LENGTH=766 /DNA_ID=CAMNT_0038670519 /DNA_START=108 /DNA_END=2408 /DNA_ORIENTATION=-